MTNITAYLTFSGNCAEAMNFYKDCLGGELMLQKVADSPVADKLPVQMREAIVHATLMCGNIVLMATDMVAETGRVKGNAVSLMLNCDSEAEAAEYYKKLSAGGVATHPPEAFYWGAIFGDLTDRYGVNWLIGLKG